MLWSYLRRFATMTKEMRPQFLGQSYQGSKKNLPAMTMVMSVRSHPSITNGEIYAALFEEELAFHTHGVEKKTTQHRRSPCPHQDAHGGSSTLLPPLQPNCQRTMNTHPFFIKPFYITAGTLDLYPGCVFRAHSSAS